MKRFSFSLEKVLRYKKLIKEEKLAKLSKANQVYYEHKQELERLRIQLFYRKKSLLSGILSPAILAHKAAFIESIAKKVAAQEKKTEEALEMVRECTKRLIEADQEQQVLEKLKERKYQDYRYSAELELQKELDEVAASAFSRRG